MNVPVTVATPRETAKDSSHATTPLISVVTPSYNQGAFLERCIQSVLDQGYANFEHIVYDNCSTDETHDILKRYPHIDWVNERDRGQSDALNKGFRKARGEIIAWINADDYYLPGAFELAARELRGGVKVIAGDVELVDPEGNVTEVFRQTFEGVGYLIEYWNHPFGLCQPGVLFRRELLEEVGYLDESLHFGMDYDFWLRVAKRYPIKVVDQRVAGYIVHPASKTGASRFQSGFRDDLEAASRRHWGSIWSTQRWQWARACNRHAADVLLHALLDSHKNDERLNWSLMRKLLRRKPLYVFHRYVLSILADRLTGRGGKAKP